MSTAEAEVKARGGAKGYRIVRLDNGTTILVAVVPKAGPRGGHTVALRGPVKGVAASSTPEPPKRYSRERLRAGIRRSRLKRNA